jgi:hypothetical protein
MLFKNMMLLAAGRRCLSTPSPSERYRPPALANLNQRPARSKASDQAVICGFMPQLL